jgi:predicted nuclease with TOPRIM domain
MNERVKELMKQAGTDTSGKWMGIDHAEKLVELVVQECQLAVVSRIDCSAVEAIKEHFYGVEE